MVNDIQSLKEKLDQEIKRRNKEIIRQCRDMEARGELNYQTVANKHGLSRERIRVIYEKYKSKKGV